MDTRLLAICRTYGVFLRKEAIALGYNDRSIARLVKNGTWHRVRHGAYVSGEIWGGADTDERYRLVVIAAIRQSKTDVVASHTSAVALHEGPTWGLDRRHAHLTREDGRTGRKQAGVHQHRGLLIPEDIVSVRGYRVIAPTRAALEVTTLADVETSLVVVDNFLHRGFTTLEALAHRYARMHFWPNTLSTDLTLRLADGRSESVAETRTRYLCWREGLPRPEPQFQVLDRDGLLIGRADLAWPEHRLFLEFDGREKYIRYRRAGETLEEFLMREKRREELMCAATGWRCVRINWADLERPDILVPRIRNLLFPGAGVA